MRTRVPALAVLALALTTAACGGSPKASPSPAQSLTDTPTSSSTASVPATPTSTPAASGRTVTIGSVMSVQAPAGWTVRRSAVYNGSGDVCLAPRRGSAAIFGCAGIAIWFGDHLPGAEMAAYAPNQENGWYSATDVQECPFVKPSGSGGKFVGLRTKPGFDRGIKPVGSHRASWNRWSADCDGGGHAFRPQAWFLPRSKVVVFDYLEHPQTDAVLASARFAADGADLSSYVSGHLVSATAKTVVVQPFHTYTNDAEGKAYANAHGLEYPFLNDYYDAEEGPERTFAIGPDTACQGNVDLGKPAEGAPIACSAFVKAHAGMPIAVWVLPGGSAAESVIEVFRP